MSSYRFVGHWLLLLAGVFSLIGCAPKPEDVLVKDAEEARKTSRFADAAKDYDQLLRYYPASERAAEYRENLINLLFTVSKNATPKEAIRTFEKVRNVPGVDSAWVRLSWVRTARVYRTLLGDSAQASEISRNTLGLHGYIDCAFGLLEHNNHDEALKVFGEADTLFKGDPERYRLLVEEAWVYSSKYKNAAKVQSFRETLIKDFPQAQIVTTPEAVKDTLLRQHWAEVLLFLASSGGDPADLDNLNRQVIAMGNDSIKAIARFQMAQRMEKSKDKAKAKEIYQQMNDRDFLTVGNYYQALGKYKEVADIYQLFIDTHPGDSHIHTMLFLKAFQYSEYIKDITESKKLYKLYLTKYPDSVFAKDAKIMAEHAGDANFPLVDTTSSQPKSKPSKSN